MKLKVCKQIAIERVRARRLVEGRDLKKIVALIKNVFPTIKKINTIYEKQRMFNFETNKRTLDYKKGHVVEWDSS